VLTRSYLNSTNIIIVLYRMLFRFYFYLRLASSLRVLTTPL
jgi:hypothetical protein